MDSLRFFGTFTRLTLGRLCRQRWLPAGLALLCFFLSFGAGRAAEGLLSRGVNFSTVTLAITAPEGDEVPQLLEQVMGGMEDISQYCRVVAMEEQAALKALGEGEVTAVLYLPENFIQGVMYGENPDLRLVVSGERPLESLLLLWIGQSAADILSAFQGGVYAVLELYQAAPPPGLTWDQVKFDINLRYIELALGRTGFFAGREISATRSLPVALHYTLALTAYLALSVAPLFMGVYEGGWLRFQRRLRSVGRGCAVGLASGVAAGVPILLLLVFPPLLWAGEGHPLAVLGVSLLMAGFCSLFCALCCLAAGDANRCGGLVFLVALVSLALAGGIVPPVLLPNAFARWAWLSPVTWLSQLGAWSMGYAVSKSTWVCLGVSTLAMTAASLALYRRGVDREEAE